jgi:hypothetical protein
MSNIYFDDCFHVISFHTEQVHEALVRRFGHSNTTSLITLPGAHMLYFTHTQQLVALINSVL